MALLMVILGKRVPTLSSTSTSEAKTSDQIDIIEDMPDKGELPLWYKHAIKEIAYYLRAHKFNEYDRRYNRAEEQAERTNYQQFPKPPLRSLHWEVLKYCDLSFIICVDYLWKKLRKVALRRQDDTAVVAQENQWSLDSAQVKQVEEECQKLRKIEDAIADPFEGPLERFQWRSTASFFMCWHTMNEIPHLSYLDEFCDNFAVCLGNSTAASNGDQRGNNQVPFACAQYSFCPDPCCPYKHLSKGESCWDKEKNPCLQENPAGQRECGFHRVENRDFSDMILNRWNITCKCQEKGYIWSSIYGICVDLDECSESKLHTCHGEGQACLNMPGSYSCVCKWGFFHDKTQDKCIVSESISKIKLTSKEISTNKTSKWKAFMRAILSVIGRSSKEGQT
ncbi:transmembrane cell adhesion receptor mua-3-like isoform X2 [Euwallacea fornicatus]|uniref:transmembrane cell adhesion receptor mua-3-like isoform X2 n=1 Tax=Euwallacea fornicatus TaxID=995702 RepID=UPI0033906CC0